jgi:hypothetical protein
VQAAGQPGHGPTSLPKAGVQAAVPLADILAVKDLVGRVGAEQLMKTLIDAFAK